MNFQNLLTLILEMKSSQDKMKTKEEQYQNTVQTQITHKSKHDIEWNHQGNWTCN